MKFHWMKIISLAAIAMVRGQNNEISFFDERERERGGGRRDCPTFVENICIIYMYRTHTPLCLTQMQPNSLPLIT